MDEQFSPTYGTNKGFYRYNYALGVLEHIGNKIKTVTINRRTIPLVETGVLESIRLNPQKFKLCPEYWVELYEAVLERTIKE